MRENEFGEKISETELSKWSSRVQKLSDKKIDKLWYLCKFIISGREKKYKAIRQQDINRIRSSLSSAKEAVQNLIAETRLKEFKRNLRKVLI